VFRLVVFDLDGTLVDSRQDLAQATNRLILEHGGRPLDQDDVVHMVGEGVEKLIARAFAAAGLPAVPRGAVPRFREIYGACLLVHTRPYAGVPEALDELSHVASLAVLTNKPREFSETILQGLGLSPLFGQLLGGDGPHAKKPDPEGLQRLIGHFDVAVDETLLVGDSLVDLQTARAGGTAIALARYGFGFRDVPRDQLKGDELLVDTPADLIDVLQDHAVLAPPRRGRG
jgi:phosphoglycolate phosphatase